MKTNKPYSLIIAIVCISLVIYFINSASTPREEAGIAETIVPQTSTQGEKTRSTEKARRYKLAQEITTPDGFINTDNKPVTIGDFVQKKVILIDFWTYSCINCQRTTPYLNAWYQKYKDKGFVIIGIHTPEFEFEKDYDNVRAAVEKFSIQFPVVLDNDFSTWTAYKNRYWPRKYLIDIDGYVIYDHIGEGQYEETEKKIQEALEERMLVLDEDGTINEQITAETDAPYRPVSPETYFGAMRNQLFENGASGIAGEQKSLTVKEKTSLNKLYLSGDWTIQDEFAQNISSNATIVYTYNAKDVFIVAQSDLEIAVEVLRDGKPLDSEAGTDISKTLDGKTIVKIKEAGLYKIIQDRESGTHTLEFRIPKAGLRAFTFTFG